MSDAPGDPPDAAAARVAAMRRLDWGSLTRRLTVKARKVGLDRTAAKDLAQDAVTRMIRLGGAGWDCEADPTATRYLLRKLENRLKAIRELEERRQELQPTELDSDKVDATPPESDRGAEGQLVSGEAALRNIERLRESLAGSPLTLAILEICVREGQKDPRELAKLLGVPVNDVYLAEAQLRRHVGKLRRDGSDPEIRAGQDDAGPASEEEPA